MTNKININKKKIQKKEFIKNKLNNINKKRRIIIGIIYGLISSAGYSIVPLMLYIIPKQGPYGNLTSLINSTFYITIQEIVSMFIIIIFYKPKKIIIFLKLFSNKKTWLVVLYGFLGGPIAMIFFQLSVLLTVNNKGESDGTVPGLLINLSVILSAFGSYIFFNINQNKYTWISLIILTFLILIMSIHLSIEKKISWISIKGMCLSLITTFFYTIETLGISHLINFSKINFTNYEIIFIKASSSALLMLLFGIPFSAIFSFQNFLDGYKIFYNFKYYNYTLIIIFGGIIMGISRILYYYCLSVVGPTYTTSTQLLIFFWTIFFQYIFILLNVPNNILKPTWYYWIYSILILFCVFIISINEYLTQVKKNRLKKYFYKLFRNKNKKK